jgi:hypothetical protein
MTEHKTCARCGHSAHWHRFDDYTLTATYNHMSPDAKFRCLGEDFNGCNLSCPDMVQAEAQVAR